MDKYFLIFDTETSGLPKKINKNLDYSDILLYQISYIKCDYLLKPIKKINIYIDIENYNKFIYVDTNKIQEKDLKNGIKIKKFLKFFHNILKNVKLIIGHNIDYDISILMVECKRNNELELMNLLLEIPKFDTMRMFGYNGLCLCKRIFVTQENAYNILFNNKENNNQDKNNNQNHYISLHDAYDDTKHCTEIFFELFKYWNNVKLTYGRFKGLEYNKTSLEYKKWFYKKKDEEILKTIKNNCYKQNNFTDYLNWVIYYFNENPEKLNEKIIQNNNTED
jgi:DNA polymerase III epsilon subunit-like protein